MIPDCFSAHSCARNGRQAQTVRKPAPSQRECMETRRRWVDHSPLARHSLPLPPPPQSSSVQDSTHLDRRVRLDGKVPLAPRMLRLGVHLLDLDRVSGALLGRLDQKALQVPDALLRSPLGTLVRLVGGDGLLPAQLVQLLLQVAAALLLAPEQLAQRLGLLMCGVLPSGEKGGEAAGQGGGQGVSRRRGERETAHAPPQLLTSRTGVAMTPACCLPAAPGDAEGDAASTAPDAAEPWICSCSACCLLWRSSASCWYCSMRPCEGRSRAGRFRAGARADAKEGRAKPRQVRQSLVQVYKPLARARLAPAPPAG